MGDGDGLVPLLQQEAMAMSLEGDYFGVYPRKAMCEESRLSQSLQPLVTKT